MSLEKNMKFLPLRKRKSIKMNLKKIHFLNKKENLARRASTKATQK